MTEHELTLMCQLIGPLTKIVLDEEKYITKLLPGGYIGIHYQPIRYGLCIPLTILLPQICTYYGIVPG